MSFEDKKLSGCRLWSVLLASLIMITACAPAKAQTPVALELALLVDVSASVNAEEFALQRKGLAEAFRSPEVAQAIATAGPSGIAVAVIQWADDQHQRLAVDWTLLRDEDEVLWMAVLIGAMPRLIEGGHTSISTALTYAANSMANNGFVAARQVIDVAGDGRNNSGDALRAARREVLGEGITINGLPIRNELPLLDRYFKKHLIGGLGAFMITAEDYHDFARAIREKLIREIAWQPVAQLPVAQFKGSVKDAKTAP